MAIRPARTEDLDAVMPLMRAYCEFYEADPPDERLRGMLEAVVALPEDQAFVLVGEREDRVAGVAVCAWKWSSLRGARIVYLDDLYVHPDARGTGLADELIEGVAEVARRHGAPVVAWLTATDNTRAQAVYDRVGGESEKFLEYELEL